MTPGSRSPNTASLTIAEGSSGTYTIVLDSQPTAGCDRHHQRPIQHGRDRGTGQLDVLHRPTGTDTALDKTVTVNAAQDADADDETANDTATP